MLNVYNKNKIIIILINTSNRKIKIIKRKEIINMEFIEVTDDFIAFLERKEVILKLKESQHKDLIKIMSHIAQSLANCFTVKSFEAEKYHILDKITAMKNHHHKKINELGDTTETMNKPNLETVSSFYREFVFNADFSTNKLYLIALFSDLRNLKKYEEDYQNLVNTLKSLLSGGDQTVKFD